MEYYKIDMKHTEESLKALSRMQYYFFRVKSRISRMIICAASIILGVSHMDRWWGLLLLIYGCFVLTSENSVAVHSADKVIAQLKKEDIDFPETQFTFYDDYIEIMAKPGDELLTPLYYNKVHLLAYDDDFFVIFKDKFGGYVISKDKFGTRSNDFKKFLEDKCQKQFRKYKKRGFTFLLKK